MNDRSTPVPDPDALELIARAGAIDVDEAKWAPQLVEFIEVVEALNRHKGIPADAAFADARDVVLALATHLGGRQFYLPRGDRLRTALRDAEIWRRFTGRNVTALAAEYGVSEIHLYAVLRQQRELHTRRHQGRLPLAAGDADQPQPQTAPNP